MNEEASTSSQKDYPDIRITTSVNPAYNHVVIAYSGLEKEKGKTSGAKAQRKGTSMTCSSLQASCPVPAYATVNLNKKMKEHEAKKVRSSTMAEDYIHYQNIIPDKKPNPPRNFSIKHKV